MRVRLGRMTAWMAIGLLSGAAAGAAEEPKRAWTNVAELGAVVTTGNSELTNFAFSNKYAYKWTKSELHFDVAGLRNETTVKSFSNPGGAVVVNETTGTTAEAYNANLQYRRTIKESLYWYGAAGWMRNEFAGLDNRLSGGGGVGYQFFKNDKQALRGEVGAEYVQEDYVGGTSANFASARGFLGYDYFFTEASKFTSELELNENLDDTSDYRARLALALISSLSKRTALKVGYTILYDNVPVTQLVPPDAGAPIGTLPALYEFEKTDTIFSASVVINF